MFHHLVRQHGDLVPRHVHRGQALQGDVIERGAGLETQRRRGDVDADAPVAVGLLDYREGIVDFRGGGIVDAEGFGLGQWQVVFAGEFAHRLEADAAREILQHEAPVVVIVAGRDRAALLQQLDRGGAGVGAGFFQRLVFEAVLVRPVEQHFHDLRGECLGQACTR